MNHRWNREVKKEGNIREELRKLTKRKKKEKKGERRIRKREIKSQNSSKPKLYSKGTSYAH